MDFDPVWLVRTWSQYRCRPVLKVWWPFSSNLVITKLKQEHSETANSAEAEMSSKTNLGRYPTRISGLIRIRTAVGSLRKCYGFINFFWRLSFRQVRTSLAVAVYKKCIESPIWQWWGKLKSNPESTSGSGSTYTSHADRGGPCHFSIPNIFGSGQWFRR